MLDDGGIPSDWRPAPEPEKISEPLSKIKNMINACSVIAEAARKVPDERTKGGMMEIHWYKISCSSSVWVDFVKAYDEVKFK